MVSTSVRWVQRVQISNFEFYVLVILNVMVLEAEKLFDIDKYRPLVGTVYATRGGS